MQLLTTTLALAVLTAQPAPAAPVQSVAAPALSHPASSPSVPELSAALAVGASGLMIMLRRRRTL